MRKLTGTALNKPGSGNRGGITGENVTYSGARPKPLLHQHPTASLGTPLPKYLGCSTSRHWGTQDITPSAQCTVLQAVTPNGDTQHKLQGGEVLMAFRSWTSLSCVGRRFSSIRLLTWLLSGLAAQPAAGLLVMEAAGCPQRGLSITSSPLAWAALPEHHAWLCPRPSPLGEPRTPQNRSMSPGSSQLPLQSCFSSTQRADALREVPEDKTHPRKPGEGEQP